jgi:hypothetical protein
MADEFTTVEHNPEEPHEEIEDAKSNKPIVKLSSGRINVITDEVQQHLLGTGLYQRGGRIVRPGFIEQKTHDGSIVLVPGVVTLTVHQLFDHATEHIAFQKYDKRSKRWVPADYPLEYVNVLLARGDRFKFPVLNAVITTPVVLGNGRIIQAPGYDEPTGLYYDPLGVEFPTVLQHPTPDEARAALNMLKKPLAEYPFKVRPDNGDTKDKNLALSVALSYLVTITNRPAYPQVPGHAFSGNNAGVGKGKLVTVGSIMAIGSAPGVIRQGERDEEFEKGLATRMLAGVTHIAIDNVDRVLKGNLLDQCISEERINIRAFGKLEGLDVLNTYTVTATGQNLIFTKDAVRRWLQGDIESPYERPELVRFNFDPVAYARDHRPVLVVAALTVIKAYIEAGRPLKLGPLGSFEKWSDDVRAALVWLGEPDPIGSMVVIRANDPKKNLEARFIELWSEQYGDKPKTIAEVTKEVHMFYENRREPGEEHPLNDVLVEIGDAGLNSKKIGQFFNNIVNMVINKKLFYQAGTRHNTAMWAVRGADLGDYH